MSADIQVRPAKLPPASTPLWAHLFRRDVASLPPDPGITITPAAPLDKNGTSMRLLLHDTQANFEKFSERVDKLTTGVEDAKKEIILVKQLFQQEHEQLDTDIVDLVNRCQTQLQRSIGEPAQAHKVEDLCKDFQSTDRRLDSLDKQIDALRVLIQTQTQTLLTQSQALQTQQDQQGKIIAALMPLLPLLQAIPLHIESARNNIKEILLTMKEHRNPDITSISDRPPQTGKRFSPTLYSDGPLSSPADTSVGHKRPRIEFEAVPAIDPQTGLNPFRSPLSATLPTHGQHIPIAAFPIQQQVPQTPHRRPLGDLLTPTNDTRANYPLSNSISSQGRKPSLASIPSPPVFHAFTPPKQRSPRTPTLISTELHFTNKEPEAPIHVNSLFSSSVSHIQQAVPKSKTLPSTSGPARFPTPSIQTTLQAQTSSNMPRPTKPPTPPDVQTSWLDRTSSKQPPSSSDTKDKSSVRSSSRIGGEGAPTRNDGDDPGTNLKEPAPKVKPMSIKDRQASFRHAHKRFIPLDDDDDDEEDE